MTRLSTRQAILGAAVTVAARQGISSATMDAVADAAGVAKGSLYYNYPNKDAIFEAVMREGFEGMRARIEAVRGSAEPTDSLRAVSVETLVVLRENTDRAKVMAGELFRTDRPWHDAVAQARSSLVEVYLKALRDSLTSGGGPVVTELAAGAFMGALVGAALSWLVVHPEQTVDEVVAQVLALTPVASPRG
ncbi:TetR/AcrR family transcriptional regulator [Demequina capsici]|uniref:TetR/AcrR family transcriptional regulator n=1 Tax=Demequina capsici TaxID=3075620 RepID=A0AA96FC70_9MICO|nr:TetR/AcrR family transcriptional regulator [Demequina sp. OYTSA14]WNM25841.1 TetR/AcrR family transcriptional regulator [Demequina sp. OYTSA14]